LRFVALPAAIVVLACKMWAAAGEGDSLSGQSAEIIGKYLEAAQGYQASLRAESMDVDISASVPQLNEHGQLHASRRISSLGRITYRVLGFQGDKTIKNQVIARYLEAEQQAHDKYDLGITPTNYKFRFKGERAAQGDRRVYVFELTPRKKRVGLFKGEMWLDATSFLPVYERGRLVKNPSIFFKRVQFERVYEIADGVPVPEHTRSTINTRLVGRVELNVKYSNFATGDRADDGFGGGSDAGAMGSLQ
jgi:hypothetical protein